MFVREESRHSLRIPAEESFFCKDASRNSVNTESCFWQHSNNRKHEKRKFNGCHPVSNFQPQVKENAFTGILNESQFCGGILSMCISEECIRNSNSGGHFVNFRDDISEAQTESYFLDQGDLSGPLNGIDYNLNVDGQWSQKKNTFEKCGGGLFIDESDSCLPITSSKQGPFDPRDTSAAHKDDISGAQTLNCFAEEGELIGIVDGPDFGFTIEGQWSQKKNTFDLNDEGLYTDESVSCIQITSRKQISFDTKNTSAVHKVNILEAQSDSFVVEKEELSGTVNELDYNLNTDGQWLEKRNTHEMYDEGFCADESGSCIQTSSRKQGPFDARNTSDVHREKNLSCVPTENDEVTAFTEALQCERAALNALYAELEEERNASAEAAKEAMRMIARLQEEKAAIQMEARQYKRMAEERKAHDHQTIELLRDLLLKKDNDTFAVEDELQTCKRILCSIEPEKWRRGVKGGNGAGLHPLEGKTMSTSSRDFLNSDSECGFDTHRKLFQGYKKDANWLTCDAFRCNLANKFDDVVWNQLEARASSQNVSPRNTAVKSRIGEDMCLPFERENHFSGDVRKVIGKNWLEKPREMEMITEEADSPKDEHDFLYAWHDPELDIRAAKEAAEMSPPRQSHLDIKLSAEGLCSPVWEHVKRLEERLECLGKQQECQKQWFCEWPAGSVVYAVGRDRMASSIKQKYNGEIAIPECLSPQQSDKNCAKPITSEKLASRTRQDALTGCELEDSYDKSVDSSEGIHDIYEVHSGLQASRRLFPLDFKEDDNFGDRLGKPDLSPPSLSESEVGYLHKETIQEAISSEIKNSCISSGRGGSGDSVSHILLPTTNHRGTVFGQHKASSDRRDGCKNMVGEEVQEVALRLQELEIERVVMTEEIKSLKQENNELKLLQEIANQLRELQGAVRKSQQTKQLSQVERCSFRSFVKGIFPFSILLCSLRPWYSKLAFLFHKKVRAGLGPRGLVGLPLLLHEPSCSRIATCLKRRLKVKFLPERNMFSQRMKSTNRRLLI